MYHRVWDAPNPFGQIEGWRLDAHPKTINFSRNKRQNRAVIIHLFSNFDLKFVKRDRKGANSSKDERGWENLSEKTEEKSFTEWERRRELRERAEQFSFSLLSLPFWAL
jgi:hypothetical protein